jgi:hypothetical protein
MSSKKPSLVLMFPEHNNDAAELEAAVKATNSCEVELIETAAQLIDRVSKGNVQGLVCNVHNFDSPFLALITKARDLCKNMLTVVVSETVDEKVSTALKKVDRIVNVDKPNSIKSMSLLCERIVHGHGIAGRQNRRFPTNQNAKVQRLESNDILDGRVFNMSKGGAYIELLKGTLNVKDVVKVVIQLDKLGKEHVVHGRVMWTAPKGLSEGNFGLGIEFVNSDEAYISMLEKI